MDNKKILQLLNMTASDNDKEALIAMRLANKILKENNIDWHSFFKRNDEIINNIVQPMSIYEKLEFCWQHIQDNDFIDSVYNFYSKKGYLTLKQQSAVEKFYNNYC